MDKKLARLPPTNLGRSPASSTSSCSSLSSAHPNQTFNRSDSLRSKGFTSQSNFPSNNGPSKSYKGRSGGRSYVQRKTPRQQQQPYYEVRTESEVSAITHEDEGRVKHRKSANHLLNFSYGPLPSQQGGGGNPSSSYGRRPGKSRLPVLTKEQFLQANCQFVVNSRQDYEFVEHLSQPDKMVPWELIEQVRLTDEQLPICPICLDVPVAAKMTKCSHIYCWPCILHYLSLSDRAWARCPICYDSVEGTDLKNVSVVPAPKVAVGEKMTFKLMKRERDSLYIRPRDSWVSNGSGRLHPINADEDDLLYSKILTAATEDIIAQLTEQRRQLQSLLSRNDTQSLEASFIQMALDEVSARMGSLSPATLENSSPTSSAGKVDCAETESTDSPITANIRPSSELKTVSYVDAFSNEMVEEGSVDNMLETSPNVNPQQQPPVEASRPQAQPPAAVSQPPASSLLEEARAPEQDQSNAVQVSDEVSGAKSISRPPRARNSSSTSGSECAEQVAADLILPPTGTQNPICERSKSKRTEVYYFYQASDGRNIYLHSINTRILAAEYGSLELAPATLTATIVESEVNSMSTDLRKRLKYLSHLPMYSQFTVCEVTLRPPVVSSAALSHFSEELARRKKARSRRVRTENRQQSKAQAEDRRRMGQYPDMKMSLNSNQHFPVAVSAPDLGYLVSESDPVSSSVSPHATDIEQHSPPLSGHMSFAQTMRGTAGTESSWRRAHASSKSLVPSAAAGSGADDDNAAPTFRDSFCADFNNLFLETAGSKAAASEQTSSAAARGKGGKRKGKKQQQLVLFSTSGQRSNN